MNDVELTKLSSKGQIVIPQQVRKEMGLKEGETFAIIGKGDTLILKKVSMPSPAELFERLHSWGAEFARKKKLKEKDLQETIKRGREL